jgi:protein-S-isoprenylcysteine O-methyltransferase Ste14
MVAMIVMIRVLEEQEAIRQFGDAYLRYRRRVAAFNLRPSCLRRLFKDDPE